MGQFEHVAELITIRTAELLVADVSVTNELGVIVASSASRSIGTRHPATNEGSQEFLRVPIRLDTRSGEIFVAAPTDGEAISPRLAGALIDLMVNEATVVARLPNQYELKNTFIRNLLMGSIVDEADGIGEGHTLGMDFSQPRAVVLIDASAFVFAAAGPNTSEPDAAEVRRRAQFIIASIVSFFSLPNDAICAYIGAGEIVVLKASTTQDLDAWATADGIQQRGGSSWANLSALKRAGSALLARLRCDTGSAVSIGIGRYHPGIRGLSQSYNDAHIALALGGRLSSNNLHCLDSLGIAAFVVVSDERTKLDLARHLLAPLAHEPELLRTLDAYFAENCSPSATVQKLGIHRNSLAHRLDKIAILLDLDPRQFEDAVQIRIAMLLDRYHIEG